MKKWVKITIAVVLVLFIGFSIWLNYPVSVFKRIEIREARSAMENHDFSDYYDLRKNYVCGMRYYGTYNGYIILFDSGPMTIVSREEIAGELFEHGSNFTLYAYKDKEFYHLKDVYEAGELSEKDIAKIAEKHRLGYEYYGHGKVIRLVLDE